METDRLIGAGILIACIVAAIIYFGFLFLGFGFEVIATVVSIGFLVVIGIGGWIGWTMASTPAPEPIEDLDLEGIEEEVPELEEVGAPEEFMEELTSIPRVSEGKARALVDSGYRGFGSIRSASMEELTEVEGIGPKLAERIKKRAAEESA